MNDPDGYLIEECNDPDDQATLEYNALVYFHSIQEDPKDKVAMRRLEETRIRIPTSLIFITIDAYLQMKKAQAKDLHNNNADSTIQARHQGPRRARDASERRELRAQS
jgi:hypothetical protein